jgi:hypothetical protein
MQEWTTILTLGGLVVTVQRRGQNGYFALSIDGLVTMRRGSQDSTGGLDRRIGCNNWPPSMESMESMDEHGSTQHHLVVVVDTRLSATSRSGPQFLLPSAFGRCREGHGGSTKGHYSGHYKGHYDQKRIDHDHDHDGHDGRGGENSGRTQGRGRDIR